jgi:hypothetical protein
MRGGKFKMDYHNCYCVNGKEFELQHHGVKGMKWGVRRYQNKDGTRTAAGKKRYRDMSDEEKSAKNKRVAKQVATALVMTASVGVAVAAYRKNPQAVNAVLSKVGNSTVAGAKKAGEAGKKFIKEAPSKAADAGKRYAKEALNSAKQGVKEGIKNAPKKATEAVVTGVTMMAAKRILDSVVGTEEAARIFQANNKKKIGSFWKVSPEDRNDDD